MTTILKNTAIRVLVVAPRFPAINQPWIDTYLEQLIVNCFDPSIFSLNGRSTSVYHSKVDQLGLKNRILSLSIRRGDILRSFLVRLGGRRDLALAWKAVRPVGEAGLQFFWSWAKAVHFARYRHMMKDVQVVHSHSERLSYDFLPLVRLQNIPLLITFHGLPPLGVGQLADRKRIILYNNAQKVLVNTEFAKRLVCSLGCDPKKVVILPQGLTLDDFPFLSRRTPSAGEPVKLLTVGRFHRDKGQAYTLLALRRLLNRGIETYWTFVGVGPDRSRLERLVKRLSLSDHVCFLEALPSEELRKCYHDCHLFVLPSITSPGGHVETQGVVLQEAQASGCIPIASRVGGIPECVNHQKDALLVKEKSSRAIADAVQYLLDRPDEWAAYQEAGRRNVEENYSADVIGQKMANLLRDVVKNWKGYEGMPIHQAGPDPAG